MVASGERWFLVCDTCGYRCFVQTAQARALDSKPPACPGCSGSTRVVSSPQRRDSRARAY